MDFTVGGTPHQVHGLRRKAVLTVLALQAGEVVSTDRLIDLVWGDAAPATAANTLQSHVSQLRRALGERTAIRACPPGYVLDLGAEATDLQTAERLIRLGTHAAHPAEDVAQIQAAVALWRGRPMSNLAGLTWFDEQAIRLEHLLLQAQQALIGLRLALGQHAELVPELEALTREHPVNEQLWDQLIRALYRSGR